MADATIRNTLDPFSSAFDTSQFDETDEPTEPESHGRDPSPMDTGFQHTNEPLYRSRLWWCSDPSKLWDFADLCDPQREDGVGKATVRFRYEANIKRPSQAQLVAIRTEIIKQIKERVAGISVDDFGVQAPRPRGVRRTLFLDVKVFTQSFYPAIKKVWLEYANRPWRFAFAGAPMDDKVIIFKINDLEVNANLPKLLQLFRSKFREARITAFWGLYYTQTAGPIPSEQDFSGKVYVVGTTDFYNRTWLPRQIDLSSIGGKTVQVWYEGGEKDCEHLTHMQNETTPVSEEHDSSTEEPVTATSNVDAPGVEALRRSDRLISSSSLLEDVVIDSDDSTEFIDRTYAPSKQKKRGRRNTDSEDERLDFELLADAATEIAEATNADRQPQTAASASPGAPSSTLDINGANAASENHSTPTQLNVRKRAKQITEDEPLAPAPCDLIAKGCITNGSPFLRSHIQNGKLMHMMRDGSSAPLSKIDGSKHLTACPIQNDSAQVRKLARNSVELVCKYVVGDLDFYPPMNPGRTETNLISRQQQDWLEDHKTELLASRRVPSQVQLIADKFSTEMGIERFHAAIFWDRFKGDGIFEGVTTKIRGKKLSEAEYKVAYSAVLATFDLLREWPDYLHPDLKFSVQEMRLAEWVSLICVAITDEFDCIIRPKNLLERLREALIALKPKLDPKVVEILADWRRKPNTEFHKKERGAGGCRPKIGGIAFDLITLDCFPQPAPGGITATTSKISVDQASNKTTTITSTHSVKVSEYLSQPGWQPFIPPQHEVHKVEDPSSPNKIAIASSVLQAGDKFVAANCILLQGKRLNVSPLAPIHANFDFVNAMTPRSPLASTIFQQVYVLSALFRDDSKGNVEVAFVFPEPAHTYVALSTQPVWQSGLAMADVRKLDFAETEGIRNPLSVLKGACRTTLTSTASSG
ncbi:hypothetical protein [Sporisorium scitamineum]|uniref:Uncharacterized protein n=1 Tax=Sporisorium scitamineum TaxID=49012 RepID=A0A0F7S6B3_9BASI|nr:hypothetical protein [Sporisorium scitamineum]